MEPVRQESLALHSGVSTALLAAALFGASTPLAKLLLGDLPPLLLAGILYLGAGIGMSLWRATPWAGRNEARLLRQDLPWLAGAIGAGGILGPVLLLVGLQATPAATASLLLNLEGVLTAVLAWVVFREAADRRIVLGMLCIVAGGALLSWQGGTLALAPGALAIIGACLCWATDNNLMQKVSAGDPLQIAALKGLVAGGCNLALALALGQQLPSVPLLLSAAAVGLLGYGVSLALFVAALRQLGTARTGAYFSLAPFIGALLALLLGEPLTWLLLPAGALMGIGLVLHLTERHGHDHDHPLLTHTHSHAHDAHHDHNHAPGTDPRAAHSHAHTHTSLVHSHHHFPDIHHRHGHTAESEGTRD